jgi:hypothetical protein
MLKNLGLGARFWLSRKVSPSTIAAKTPTWIVTRASGLCTSPLDERDR